MTDPIQVARVCLAVHDLASVASFYREVLGLREVGSGPGFVELGVAERGFLRLLHRPGATPDDPATAGLYHLALLLPSRADLAAWFAHAQKAGEALAGSADHLVSEAFYLADPEGNGIEVYADRPRAQWRWTEGPGGRRIQMANRPIDAAGLLLAAAPWTGAPAGTRIGHVHLRVGDVDLARRFYGGVLGLDMTAGWPGAAFLSSGGYHHHLAANSWHSAGAGPRDRASAGLVAITLEADTGSLSALAGRGLLADPDGALHDPWGMAVFVIPSPMETVS